MFYQMWIIISKFQTQVELTCELRSTYLGAGEECCLTTAGGSGPLGDLGVMTLDPCLAGEARMDWLGLVSVRSRGGISEMNQVRLSTR